MLVGVGGVGRLALHLEELAHGVRRVLVVLAQHGPGLGLEGRLAVAQVLKAVCLQAEPGLQILLGEERVIVGEVVTGEGVLAGPALLQLGIPLLWRGTGRAPEHHVLKEVGEA